VNHHTLPRFWIHYRALPESIQKLADKNFKLLKVDPRHPSLHLKKVMEGVWSVRVGVDYRALARDRSDGLHWFWIGPHAKYDKILQG
jgi:hypothetical protein